MFKKKETIMEVYHLIDNDPEHTDKTKNASETKNPNALEFPKSPDFNPKENLWQFCSVPFQLEIVYFFQKACIKRNRDQMCTSGREALPKRHVVKGGSTTQ